MGKTLNDSETDQLGIGAVSTCFSPYNYACDMWCETLSTLTPQEIVDLELCKNKEEVDEYIIPYHENS